TLPPKGGPSPGAMGTGPNAPTAERRPSGALADIALLPLRPETVTPTAPPPAPHEVKEAVLPEPAVRLAARPPLTAKLATPAPTPPPAPECRPARRFGEEMVRRNFMVITGAGAGIMEAAQGGAGRQYSFGVNIKLPFEQAANPFIQGDKKLIHFRYFFTRKL